MAHLYKQYRSLTEKQKQKLISEAEQHQKYRRPNPQGTAEFDEYSWLQFCLDEDGKKIKMQTYRKNAKGETKGIVFMFHGLNSHVGHGAHIADYLAERGFVTVGFDHRGFGRSQGREGYVETLDSHLDDSRQFINLVLKIPEYKKLPRFLLGLSMGGMTSFYLSLKQPQFFAGAVLMAPALMSNLGGALTKVAKFISSVLPTKTKLARPVYGTACKNPAITQFIKQDKYAFSQRMYLSTVKFIVHVMDTSLEHFSQYRCPFMVIQGGRDKLVNPDVAFQLYDRAKTAPQDKELLFYQDMWHDVWHEDEIHEILPRVGDWMGARAAGKTQGVPKGEEEKRSNNKVQE